MYPRINEKIVNKFQYSFEGNDIDIKKIIKFVNHQSTKLNNNPFSNIILKNSLMTPKMKTINNIRKNNNAVKLTSYSKKKKKLSLNEYINIYNNNKYLNLENEKNRNQDAKRNLFIKLNTLNKFNKTSIYNDENCFLNCSRKFYKYNTLNEKRKIISLNNARNRKKIFTKKERNKFLSTSKNNTEKKLKIKRMNSTNNSQYNNILVKNKTIQKTKLNIPNDDVNKINSISRYNKISLKKKNSFNSKLLKENNNERIKSYIYLLYKKKSDQKLYFQNTNIRNENVNSKNLTVEKNKKLNHSHSIKTKDIPKITKKEKNINEYNHKTNIFKNKCININTLLSLIKK